MSSSRDCCHLNIPCIKSTKTVLVKGRGGTECCDSSVFAPPINVNWKEVVCSTGTVRYNTIILFYPGRPRRNNFYDLASCSCFNASANSLLWCHIHHAWVEAVLQFVNMYFCITCICIFAFALLYLCRYSFVFCEFSLIESKILSFMAFVRFLSSLVSYS